MFDFLRSLRVGNARLDALEGQLAHLAQRVGELEDMEANRKARFAALELDVTDLVERLTRQMNKLRQRDIREAKRAAGEDGGEDAPAAPAAQQKLALYRRSGLANGGSA